MKKILLLLLLAVAWATIASAQSLDASGVVLDEAGEPIIGALVKTVGTKKSSSTMTDCFGRFSLKVRSRSQQLTIACIGMEPQTVTAAPTMNIVLKHAAESIDEVVVVGYGIQRKSSLTSSISSVKGEAIAEVPVASVDQAIQGKATGVQVTTSSGLPGGAVAINIRGIGSITAGNDPLYVIDGLPVISEDLTLKGGYQGNSLSGIADLNPNDIESVEVLKDASATALYGSRASNGVVLITTKSGRVGKTRVNLSAYAGIQDLPHTIKMLDASSYVAARNEAIDNYNTSLGLSEGDGAYRRHVAPAYEGVNTDWFDAITRSAALQTSEQLSVTGGNEKTQFYVSLGYYNQQGVLDKTGYSRYNLRSNIEHWVFRNLRIAANIGLSYSDTKRPTGDGNIYSPWGNALLTSPDYPIYNPDGSYASVNAGAYNPVQLTEEDQQTRKYRALFNLKLDWTIIPHLVYRLNLGGDYNLVHDTGVFSSTSIQGATSKGEVSDYRGLTYTHLAEHTLDYARTWGDFDADFLLGYSYQYTRYDNAGVSGINFLSPSLRYLDSAGTIDYGTSSLTEEALQSVFGRVSVSYADRYLLEASLRNDASSKFAPDKRSGLFPTGSFGWRVFNESFFPKHTAISDLKLRGSIGYTGNIAGIGNYSYFNIYSSSGVKYEGNPGLGFPSYKPNPELTWEKTLQYDLGLDVALFNNRLSLTFDWFKKDTKDLLLSHSINGLSGYSMTTSNVGSITNDGVELSVTSRNFTGDFKWTTTLNLSYSRSEVTGLVKDASGNDTDKEIGFCNILRVGEPLAEYYMIRADGIYQSKEEILAQPGGQALWDSGIRPGDVRYYDKDENGVINDADRVLSGSPFPSVFGSLDNTFAYKGFDLDINLQYALGHKLYAAWKAGAGGASNQGGNSSGYAIFAGDWEKRWTPENPSGTEPRAVAGGAAYTNNTRSYTTRFLENADFLRIANITLGYTLPSSLTRNIGIERARFYASVTNLYTFTPYDGFDPEVALWPSQSTYRGYDSGAIPRPRTFLFGFNLSF